eukprot:GHVR01105054.1.p1 GENE.GHVR01105054.1~~GHVR01105054.1.p1  ORF type:complete len:165 (+),score=28.63 GHVR01105054.1:263-757(+)
MATVFLNTNACPPQLIALTNGSCTECKKSVCKYLKCVDMCRVGVHWDTPVYTRKDTSHNVCQVFCSAMPVAYAKSTNSSDWRTCAQFALTSAYLSTLAIAAIHAAKRGRRVSVFLTCLGGGAFGNRREWIKDSMVEALNVFKYCPLDVVLVHYSSIDSLFKNIF